VPFLVAGVVEMFRTIPPLDLVEQVLRSLKLSGLSDKRWFSKDELPMDSLEEWLPSVEPYYLPCKAQRYLHRDLSAHGVITVLRHLLKVHDIELKTQEKMINGRKTTLYQVFYEYVDPVVRFD
jgi:hypothetical protein